MTRRHAIGTREQLLKPPQDGPQRPGRGPPAPVGGSTRRSSSRATASSLACTVRVVPSAVPSSSHCPDIQASGNTATTSWLSSDSANSSRSGPLNTSHSSTAAISLAVARSHRRHVHSSSATSEPGRVPPRSPRSRLMASRWLVLDPPSPWGLDQEPAQLIGIACGGQFFHPRIAVASPGPHRPKLRQPRQPRPGIGCRTAHLASSPKVTKVISGSRPIRRVASGPASVPLCSREATSVSKTVGSTAEDQAKSR